MAAEQIPDTEIFATDTFGITNTEFLEDGDDPLFGPAITADPKKVTLLTEEDKKPKEEPKPKVEVKTVDTIDLLDNEESLEEPVTEPKPKEKKQVGEETEEENPFAYLAEELSKLNVFTTEEGETEEEITTPEQFRDRFVKEIQKQSNSYLYNQILEPFGQEGIDMFEAIFVNGVHPNDYLTSFNKIENISAIDITKEGNQEKVVREYYTQLGWKPEKIDAKVQKLKDTADLEDEAQVVHEKLVESEQANIQQMEAQAKQRKLVEQQYKQEYLQNLNTILADKLKAKEFDGIPVTEKVAKETIDYLYTEKYRLPSGEKLTEFDKDILDLRRPENHQLKVKMALLLKSKLDLTKVKRAAVSKETDALFGKFSREKKITNRLKPEFNTNEDFL